MSYPVRFEMRIEGISLNANLGSLLELKEPFWIASCHYSERKSAIDTWVEISPAALTLKSCKRNRVEEQKERARTRLLSIIPHYGKSVYCDGPKHLEFMTYEEASILLDYAKNRLPDTEIGLSVLADLDEDYALLREVSNDAADFYELNLKYTFRQPKDLAISDYAQVLSTRFAFVLNEVNRFCEAMKGAPVLVKLSRELDQLLEAPSWLSQLLDEMRKHRKCGLVIANSLKTDLSDVMYDGKLHSFRNGVVCGQYLFDGTLGLIGGFAGPCKERRIPIVASGGMINEEHILKAFMGGASAVQLCTAFDYHGPNYYSALRTALKARIRQQGLGSFREYFDRLGPAGVPSIYNELFDYFDRFWSETAQAHILSDIRRSRTMDIAVMSPHMISDRWRGALEDRFRKNLGMRLFLPDTIRGGQFRLIAASLGVRDGSEMEAQAQRARDAAYLLKEMWDRRVPEKHREEESKFELFWHNQFIPLAYYVFDENVYICPYATSRPTDEADMPAYVFFAISKEYARVVNDLEGLRESAKSHRRTLVTPSENTANSR